MRYAAFLLVAVMAGAGGGYLVVNKTTSSPVITQSGAVPAIPAQSFPRQVMQAIPAVPAKPPVKSSAKLSCPKIADFSQFSLLDKNWNIKDPQPVLRDSSGNLYTYMYSITGLRYSKDGSLFTVGFTQDSINWIPVVNKSTDNGVSWTAAALPLMAPYASAIAYTMTEDQDGTLYIGGEGLWKSTDGGNTWNVIASLPYKSNYYGGYTPVTFLTVTKDNSLIAVFGYAWSSGGFGYPSMVAKSTDGGKTWTELFNHKNFITYIVEANDGAIVFRDSEGGNPGGVYRYSNGTITKTFSDGVSNFDLSTGLLKSRDGAIYLHTGMPIDIFSGITEEEQKKGMIFVYKSTDNGTSWTRIGRLPDSWDLQGPIVETSDGTFYVSSWSNCDLTEVVYKSRDKGLSWNIIAKAPKFGDAKSIDDRYFRYEIRALIEERGGGVLIGGNAPIIFLAK